MSRLVQYLAHVFPVSGFVPAATDDKHKPRVKATRIATGKHELAEVERHSSWSNSALIEHFMANYGVSVRIDGRLYLFKYYVILQGKNWDHPVLLDARGTIARRNDDTNKWEVACRPYEKFFNQQEKHCPVHSEEAFNQDIAEYTLVEKADGTMVSVWWRTPQDNVQLKDLGVQTSSGFWQVSTSTSIRADESWLNLMHPMFSTSPLSNAASTSTSTPVPATATATATSETATTTTTTMAVTATTKSIGGLELELTELDKEYTYMFELCCEANRIITRYPEDCMFLIAAIHNATGKYASHETLDGLATRLGSRVRRPLTVRVAELGLGTLTDVLAWIEKQATNPAFGTYPEGFVVFWKDQPLCKMKNRPYAAMHNFYAENLPHMRNLILERFFDKTVDDVIHLCPQPILEYLEELAVKVHQLRARVHELLGLLMPSTTATQTEEAAQQEAKGEAANREMVTEAGPKNEEDYLSAPSTWYQRLRQIIPEEEAWLRAFYSRIREQLMQHHEVECDALFIEWLEKNWRVKREYFKETKIAAFAEYEAAQRAKQQLSQERAAARKQQQQQQSQQSQQPQEAPVDGNQNAAVEK